MGLVGGVLVILAVAVGLTNTWSTRRFGRIDRWTTTHVESKLMFLLRSTPFLLIVGTPLMGHLLGIVVVVPLISGVAAAYGIIPCTWA